MRNSALYKTLWILSTAMSSFFFFEIGKEFGNRSGFEKGKKQALTIDRFNEDLEVACLNTWVSDQNRIYIERGLNK